MTLTVIDPSVGWDSADVVITSEDVPPVLTAPGTSQSTLAGVSTSINLGTLTLTGIGPFIETVQWGDGQTSTFSPTGSGPLSLAHTYATAGTYTIGETVSEYDGGTATASVAISVTQEPTSTLLTSSTASVVYGQSLTFTATVTGPGAPTGAVAFYAGPVTPADQIGSGTLILENGQYEATFSTSALSASGSPYAITAVYGGDADNQGSPSNVVSETITKANAVIVVTPYTVSFDGNPHTATGTATGVETPNPANLSGLLNLSGTTHIDIGTYTDTWTFAGNGNYNSASGTITDLITQPLSVTAIAAISPNPRTTPVSTVDVTFSLPIDTSSPTAGAVTLTDNGSPVAVSGVSFALVPGTTSTYQVGDLSTFTADGGSYTLTINAADIDDQYGNPGTGSLSTSWLVNGTTPTISWANPADIVYGTALSATQLDATANVLGTFTYTLAAGTILGAGNNQTLSVLFTPDDTTDYTSAFATTSINVLQATPTINWSNPANIVYGTALSATQLDATSSWTVGGVSGNVEGTFTYTPAAGTVLVAGNNQTLSVSLHARRRDRLHDGLRDGNDQRLASNADHQLVQSCEHRLRHGAERNAVGCHVFLDRGRPERERGGNVHLHLGRRDRPGRRQQPDALGPLHAHRHGRLHHGLRDGDDRRFASNSNHQLVQSCEHRLRHGAERNAVECHLFLDVGRSKWERGGNVYLHPGRGDRSGRRQQPDALGPLHARRRDRLHDGLRDGNDQRLASNADHQLVQSSEHRLRHGAERNAVGCHLFMDGGWSKWERGGNVYLHPSRGHRVGRRQQPDALGSLHARRRDRLHDGLRDGNDQRLASNADHQLVQSCEHRLRHGAERNAVGCHVFLDGGRPERERGGNVHLHPGRRDRHGRRQQPDALGPLHARPTRPITPRPPRRRRSTSRKQLRPSVGPILRTSSTARR